MPKVPAEILSMARTHHAQLLMLEREARVRVSKVLDRALRRITIDREYRVYSDLEALQASEIEILAKLTARDTTADLEVALGEILDQGLLMAPTHASREIGAWLAHHGAEARPLNLAALSELSRQSVIERIPNSLARWGPDVARRVREELAAATASKTFAGQTIDALQGALGAERWKADRIFRTELFTAYNGAHLEGLTTARDTFDIPVKKSAIVTFDSRTGSDSYPMQAQVRELEEMFVDGDGRRFLHPPGRPNDREKEIPWIDEGEDYDLISTSEGVEKVEAERARNRELAGKVPSARGPAPPAHQPLSAPDTFEGRRERALIDWTNGSSSSESIALKEAARTEFGLDGALWNPRGRGLPDPDGIELRRSDIRRTYEETQEFYSGRNAGSVKLYRGVKGETGVGGALESWTDDLDIARKFAGRNGNVISSDIDTRRILSSIDAPGWRNGRYGNQREFLLLSDPPELRFDAGDWQSGPLSALDFDPNATKSGQWGILQDSSGRSRLEHIPSERTFLQGREYTREGLEEIAKQLDRSGVIDGRGITALGESTLDELLDVYRIKYAAAVPDDIPGVDSLEIFGDRLGLVNQKLKPGPEGTWSRRTIGVIKSKADGYDLREVRCVVRGNFAIVTENEGPGDGYFTLVHTKTGTPIFSGGRTFYSAGNRVPIDIGGFKLDNIKELGDRLEDYFDPSTGAILDAKRDELEAIVKFFRSEDIDKPGPFSIYDDSDIGDWIDDAIAESKRKRVPGIDPPDEFDDPFVFATPRGPTPSYAREAKKTYANPDAVELSADERFGQAVERRRNALRRGRYDRHSDLDFDRAVQGEASRLNEIDTQARLSEKKEKIGFEIEGEGRGFVDVEREKTERANAPKYLPGDSPDEVKAKQREADDRVWADARGRKREREEEQTNAENDVPF